MPNHTRIAIIGSGPAGLTAAIYAARANLNPIVLGGITPGGQLMLTTLVENYPGFSKGIMGPQLMNEMIAQAKHAGAQVLYKNVEKIDTSKRPFTINTDEQEYTADAIIVATGASAKWLGLESEQKYIGKGVTSCATCDGFFYKGKTVAVVGGGDTAMEEALYLSHIVGKLYLIHRRDEFRASKIMVDRVKKTPNIELVLNSEITEVTGNDLVTGINVKNTQTNETKNLDISGLFVAIGHTPNTKFLEGEIDLDEMGYVKTQDEIHTNVEGVFVAGDVHDHLYRQAITAAGMGCRSAIIAERWLSEHE